MWISQHFLDVSARGPTRQAAPLADRELSPSTVVGDFFTRGWTDRWRTSAAHTPPTQHAPQAEQVSIFGDGPELANQRRVAFGSEVAGHREQGLTRARLGAFALSAELVEPPSYRLSGPAPEVVFEPAHTQLQLWQRQEQARHAFHFGSQAGRGHDTTRIAPTSPLVQAIAGFLWRRITLASIVDRH